MFPKKLRQLIPPEHGAWGFLSVAVAAGLGVAPTAAGVLIAVGVIIGVVARHAVQLALSGRHQWPAALSLGTMAAAAWLQAWWWAPDTWPWLAGATGLTVLQVIGAIGSRRHNTASVLVGGVALALVGGAIAAARPLTSPEIVVGAIIGYLIAITPLVRALRQPHSGWVRHALAGHLTALAGAIAARFIHDAPLVLIGYFTFLTGRCLWLTRPLQRPQSPKAIGLAEIPLLVLLVLSIALGVRLNW